MNFKNKWKAIKSYKNNPYKPHTFQELIYDKEIQFIRTIIGKNSGKVIFTMHPYKGRS